MPFARLINKIARLFNKWVMVILALVIAGLLFTSDNDWLITTMWLAFIAFSAIFSLNGILLKLGFNREIRGFLKAGKPIKGVDGYEELVSSLSAAQKQSYLITFSSALAFGIYYFRENFGDQGEFGSTLAIAMAFISISVMFLVDYPEDPSLTPGGLVGFFEPDSFPLILDNLLSDVFATYLDPVTLMKYDDWSVGVLNMLVKEYESDESSKTRLERAREKILLLAYLSFSNPHAFDKHVVEKELTELFGANLKNFKKSKKVGLTWKEIVSVTERISKRAPEPFKLVDRLMIELTDNYYSFTHNDLYFTVGAKSNQGSVIESTGLIAFFINTTQKSDRDIKVWYRTDRLTIHPHYAEVNITLDRMTDPFPEKKPPLISTGGETDILTLLSTLLQVGDAVWFRIQTRAFGYKVITVYAEEEAKDGDRSPTMGRSFEMKFTKSIGWYVKTFAPKLSALGGIALPFLKDFLPFV